MALSCLGFAAVNVLFEITDYFVGGPYAEYASEISVANWSVVVLNVVGAAAALLSVAKGAVALGTSKQTPRYGCAVQIARASSVKTTSSRRPGSVSRPSS